MDGVFALEGTGEWEAMNHPVDDMMTHGANLSGLEVLPRLDVKLAQWTATTIHSVSDR